MIRTSKPGIDSADEETLEEERQGSQPMSNVNVKRAIENIRATTSVYTPVVETIVNAIQAIEDRRPRDGKVTVRVIRSDQLELDDELPAIIGFKVEDNGIGFTQEHRDSFDTLYTDLKITEGGKGFGRFTCLKYFEDLHVDSVFKVNGVLKRRRFSMGKENDIIVSEKVSAAPQDRKSGSIVWLDRIKKGIYEKKLTTLARTLVEKLLPYFITEGYTCPTIELCEEDGSDVIRLNAYFTNELAEVIQEMTVSEGGFTLSSLDGDQKFSVRVFKFLSPRNQKSKVSLVAHRREVTSTAIHNYIPEFFDEFCEKDSDGNDNAERNYIIKAYVFGDYLDDHVSLERGEFEFRRDSDGTIGVSQEQIEKRAADIAMDAVGSEIYTRQERKRARVINYVDTEAPWHKAIVGNVDLSALPSNPTPEDIESRLQRAKFSHEMQIKRDVRTLLASSDAKDLKKNVAEIVSKITETSKNDLIHYIALRRNILELLEKSLEVKADGKYAAEGVVHDIILPRKGDTDSTHFEDHNLWLVDERLNFTAFISSDLPLDGRKGDRADLLIYNNRISFRGDNEASNPITIFELKKPNRDDFAAPASREDPIEQIVRYVNKIRDGKLQTPKGREILVTENTPFYGFVICTLTAKVKRWLEREKDFKPMPDGLGWFHWRDNIRLYMEVLSWDKVLKDANMRNAVFFRKLGI